MKKVLITGASGGIGSAITAAFADGGYAVIMQYNNGKEAAETLAAQLSEKGCDVCTFKADLRDEKQIKAIFEQVGDVDILVNNAGISRVGCFQDMSTDEWDEIFAVNMRAYFLCAKQAVGGMLRRGGGRIINISSMWGSLGASCEVAYSATKAAVNGFTKALAKELAPSNITVNAVAPGLIDTKMNAHLSEEEIAEFLEGVPLGRVGTAKEVARTVTFLASDAAAYITGQIIGVDGGMS